MLDFKNPECIISLTSWKGRIYDPTVAKVLYSIFKQETQYRFKVVLVLSLQEFPNKEKDLPDAINLFNENELFEIIWVEKNLKAYKKLHYTIEKYPDLPILTTDDDMLLNKDIVETYMNLSKEHPNTILSEDGFILQSSVLPIAVTGWFRLYPPHSIRKADENEFAYWFKETLEDDVYNGTLAYLANTKTILRIHTRKLNQLQTKNFVSTAFARIYTRYNGKAIHDRFCKHLKSTGELK